MTDFIIVGRGLAATTLMHRFYQKQINFQVIGNETLSQCSKVAAGIWNPVVFKRLTKSWMADELVTGLLEFYTSCEETLAIPLITQRPIIKPFTEDQEKTLWNKKSKAELEFFLDPEIRNSGDDLNEFKIPNQYGCVNNSGNLNVALFLETSADFFKPRIKDETFDYAQLSISKAAINYKGIEAKNIIFCEGYCVRNNPFFSWIPLKPAKGEIITIEAPKINLPNAIFNRNGFLMNTSGNRYKVGATYEWQDLSENTTIPALEELESKLKAMTNCEYSILKHEAGIRPSSIDRRPIIGKHPEHEHLFVFNGLGTKGVMLSPYFSENFVNFYLNGEELHPEINLKRFYHLYGSKK